MAQREERRIARCGQRYRAVARIAALLAAHALLASSPLRAETQELASQWQFAVTPYVWLPHIDASLGFETPGTGGSAGQGVDLWDGVVGFRGSARLGAGNWFVPYYLDAGAGTSKFTWQGLLGIGYSFRWGDLLLVYRYLTFEQGDDKPVQRLEFAGPALGATFHF